MIGRAMKDTVRSLHKLAAPNSLPDRLSILFHELVPEQWPAFRRFVSHCRQAGYRFVAIDEYLSAAPGDKVVFVSFDDCLQSWFEALPVFEDLGVPAMFYVNSLPLRGEVHDSIVSDYLSRIGYCPNTKTLSINELVALHAAGHTIGCHTHSHFNLATLPREKWDVEILNSKRLLEEIIGVPVVHFSYPFGMRRFFNEDLRAYCRDVGFATVAAGIPGRLYEREIDPFDVQRTRWQFSNSHERNIEDVGIDGRWFEALTGRSAVG